MAGFLTFFEPEDLTKLMDLIKSRVAIGFGSAVPLTYNPAFSRQTSLASLIEGLDVFGRLAIRPPATEDAARQNPALVAETRWGKLSGFHLFSWLTCQLPLLWPLVPIFGLPFLLIHSSKETTPSGETPTTTGSDVESSESI